MSKKGCWPFHDLFKHDLTCNSRSVDTKFFVNNRPNADMRFGSRILPVLCISPSDLLENIIDFARFPGVDWHSHLRLYLLLNDRKKLLNNTIN